MARAAVLERLTSPRSPWQTVAVRDVIRESDATRTLQLDVAGWPPHRAGQHLDVRLTAEDGYQAERAYSISSAPEDEELAITVERVPDGEVSPYLVDELRPGDQLEVRGPIGGHFSWSVDEGGPVLLVAGGSGIAPLMAMLRHRRHRRATVDARLLASVRGPEDAVFATEIAALAPREGLHVAWTYTRRAPEGWNGFARRVDAAMLAEVGPPASVDPRCFVCGPTPFVEAVATLLVDAGHHPGRVHAERFGPTGDA